MKLSLSRLAILSALFGISINSFAFPDITGTWRCSGYDPYLKRNFSSSGEIQKNGDAYILPNWKDEATGQIQNGSGIKSEKIENTFAAIFWPNFDPSMVMISVNKVYSANKMVGTWAFKNGPLIAEHTCERIGSK